MNRPVGMPLTDEEIAEAVAAYEAHQTMNAAADAMGIPRTNFRRRIAAAAERGMLGYEPVLPGFKLTKTSVTYDKDGEVRSQTIAQHRANDNDAEFQMPEGHVVKGVSALVGPDGNLVQQWIKTKLDPYGIEWTIDAIKAAFVDYEGRAEPIPPPQYPDHDYLNLIPCNDWHVNLLCWSREVDQNWDLKIAERAIGEAMEIVISSARRAGTAVVLGGGDLMHNDDNTNRTAKSGNVLDADGRHQKGMEVTLRLMVRTIDIALLHNENVIVRILKGNHDEQSSVAIAYFLHAWYRNEPRVTVDLDASLYWFLQFGDVMLSATHGHTVKLKEMPQIMAHRRAKMWGQTKFRYAHGFHIHHKEVIAKEGEGVVCESHQAPIPPDAWHFGAGYLSGRSVQVITYHKELGEFGRRREPVRDAVLNKPLTFLLEAA